MENEISNQFKQILKDFLSELQLKMDDFSDKLNLSGRNHGQLIQCISKL